MEISSFHQYPDESLSEALDCFHQRLRKTPTHGYSEPVQLNIFIDGLQPQSKQLVDASAGGKIKLKTPKEAMELIQNMAASDHVILRDRTYVPTKRSLLELTTQDATLAQNKLLSQQIEALTETLNKLPQQLQAGQSQQEKPPISIEEMLLSLIQETRETRAFIQETRANTQEIREFIQETRANTQETKAFIQETRSQQKSTDAAIRNLEIQIGQLAESIAEKPTETFAVNAEMKPKEDCKVIFTEREEEEKKTKEDVRDEEGEKKEERERNEEKA
ncbi:hypothetical protein GmHk_14G042021 [Glycine max]|nr:hypothetical protein GmHk_14G042021 [Glycine max]